LAAADCAEGRGEPPPALTLAWRCDRWHALPEAGGMRQQPYRLMQDMSAAANVYQAISAWRSARNWADWSQANPQMWKVVAAVLKLRRANG